MKSPTTGIPRIQQVPLKHASVTIYDQPHQTLLGSGFTDDNGNFSIGIANPYPNAFDVNVWTYSAYVDPDSADQALRVVSQGSSLSGYSNVWTVYTGPIETTNGTHIQDIGLWYPGAGSDGNHAFMLFQDLIRARDFIGWDVGSVTILWNPTSSDGDYYIMGGQIHLKGETYKSADTSIHEFGHNYMWTKKGSWTNTCPSPHYIQLGDNPQCAYTEGWPDFLSLAVNGNPTYTWASGSTLNLETPTWGTPIWDEGDGCEGRVAGALWDMYDNINDGYDQHQFSYSLNDAAMRQNTGWTFSEFWNTWKSSGYSSQAVWSIYQNTIDYIPPPVLTISASPKSVIAGTPANVNFTVKNQTSGLVVSGATVTLTGVATGSGITGTDGNATISVNAGSPGTITATASKTGYTSNTTTVTANPAAVTPVLTVSASPMIVTAGIPSECELHR